MAAGWTRLRHEQHDARFPPDERRERRRQAVARYRQRHRQRLAQAREVGNILLRQDTRHGDLKRLATLLRQLAGPDGIKALRTELGRRRQ